MSAIPQARHTPLLERLNDSSRDYRDPLAEIPWDSLDRSQAWLPDELVSLHGLPVHDALSPAQRTRLSQCEYVAFAELGLWLEALFMQRISRNALQQAVHSPAAYEYQLHELREEVGHSLMFLELMRRSGIPTLTPMDQRPRAAALFARLAPYHSAAFWTTILIGEEVPDRMNRIIRQHRQLPAAVLAMTQLHMREEARHMAYARLVLKDRLPRLGRWQRKALQPLLRVILRQFLNTCFYPGPQVYAAAGLDDPAGLARAARANPARQALVRRCAEPTLLFLREHDIKL